MYFLDFIVDLAYPFCIPKRKILIKLGNHLIIPLSSLLEGRIMEINETKGADDYVFEGAQLLHEGKFLEAFKKFKQAQKADPDHTEAFYMCGNALGSLKRYDDAIAQYQKALALDPTYAGPQQLGRRSWGLEALRRRHCAVSKGLGPRSHLCPRPQQLGRRSWVLEALRRRH